VDGRFGGGAAGAGRRDSGLSSGRGFGGAAGGGGVGYPGYGDGIAGFDPATAFGQVSQAQLVPQADYLEQRANAVADVQQHINDLGQIFQKLAHMVHEQGGMLARCVGVHAHTSPASAAVSRGVGVVVCMPPRHSPGLER
jgi:hypothetical protein